MKLKNISIITTLMTLGFASTSANAGLYEQIVNGQLTSSEAQTMRKVDAHFGKGELRKARVANESRIDRCLLGGKRTTNFGEVVSKAILLGMKTQRLEDKAYNPYYFMTKSSKKQPTSLISNRMCSFTESEMKKLLHKKKNYVGSAVRARVNKSVNYFNKYRTIYMDQGAPGQQRINAFDKLHKFYGKFMGCLSYAESLSNPDEKSSRDNYKKFVGMGYFKGPKPSGVNYHVDRPGAFYDEFFALLKEGKTRTEAKKEAIRRVPKSWPSFGLYQFASELKQTNISACVDQWNKTFKAKSQCQIKKTLAQYNEALGTKAQAFNAFCGVFKIAQQMDTLINTQKAARTANANIVNGKLKKAPNRCMSLFAKGGSVAYVHFGPLANSVPKTNNLDKVANCLAKSL